MGATIVVGGQYGSEGKGKVVALEAHLRDEPWVVRCGGPNSGHTTSVNGVEKVLRQLPAAAGQPGAMLFLSAGCAVDEDVLVSEIEYCGIPRERLVIDPRAVLISDADRSHEKALVKEIGSTGSGTGAALSRRMMRRPGVRLVNDSDRLHALARIAAVAPLLHQHIDHGGDVLVEGTQGFGLSLHHGPHYPHVTSRDTTASGFASEVGLCPHDVTGVIMVVRTFPIRVGGNSGPLPDELTWEEVRQISGAAEVVPEYTSVTHRVRRVARFDFELLSSSCRYNRPTWIAVMGLDRLDAANSGLRESRQLSRRVMAFLREIATVTGLPIRWAGTGFSTWDASIL